MIDELAMLPLAAQPGSDWRYGPSVDIPRDQLSGKKLDLFPKTTIFEPLETKDTGFWVDASTVLQSVNRGLQPKGGDGPLWAMARERSSRKRTFIAQDATGRVRC